MAEFRNPNQGGSGGDSRSFLVMMVVMVVVIVGLQLWRSKTNPQTAAPAQTAAVTPASPSAANTSAAPAAAVSGAARTGATANATATPAVQAAAESSTVVENELYRITFSNRGGQVSSWVLKRYTDAEGKPLDLVHAGASKLYGYPLSLYTYDAALTTQLTQALYVPSATGTLQSPATLSFDYAAGNVTVKKTCAFGADYTIHADTVVTQNGAPIRALLTWPAGFGDMETGAAYANAQVDTGTNGHDEHIAFKKISGGATLNGPFDFAGISDQYFATIFLPDAPANATVATFHQDVEIEEIVTPQPWYKFGSLVSLSKTDVKSAGSETPKGWMKLPILGAAAGSVTGHNQTRLFVGPKDIDVLKSVKTADGHNLEPLLDFGFWGPVGKALFLGLHWVHGVLPGDVINLKNFSWGWAIVIFTILINLVLLPLRIKGMKSMLAMQRIQPGIDAIKAKYKNPKATDPKMGEMNAEVMAYQKEKGVSMFGGCIPSLIQLPLLFAFFTMMNRVVELRHAHFFWLPDLSSSDPYHILPIMMVITSFLVQFYTPSPGVDPQQQKMMAFMMPAFSGYMTWNYASGLALYWNVGNLIMIAQQQVMNRTALGREIREIQARRAKKVIEGKPGVRSTPGPRTIPGRR